MKAALTTALVIQAVTPGHGDPVSAADSLVRRHVKVHDRQADLVVDRTLRDGDHAVVRYVLQVDGAPVLGRGAAVRVGPEAGAPALVHAHVGLGPVSGRWRLTRDDAAQVAAGALTWPALRAPPAARRAVLPGQPGRRVWLVDLSPRHGAPMALRIVVDGEKPEILDWARVDLGAGRANVYPTNPVTSEVEERQLAWLDDDTDVLEGRFARVYRCRLRDGECEERNAAVADPDGDYLYEPDDEHGNERDPFAEVSAYYHISRMRELMGELGLGDDELRRIQVWVNWPNLNNAAFVSGGPGGVSMIFGQGRRDFAYDGDVVYHEYGHAVVSVTAGLLSVFGLGFGDLDYRPGALNEGIADQFATALSDDSRLGEYAGGYRYGGEVRDMDGSATCPGAQIGEEHHDSQPWGQAMWEVRQGLGDEDYLPLAWSTLTMLLPSSGIAEAAEVMTELAEQRFVGDADADKLQAVVTPMREHALDQCQRYVPLVEGPGHSAVSMSASELTQGQLRFDMPAHLQHTVEVPEGTKELRLVKRMIGCVLGCEQQILLRHEEPVTFRLVGNGTLSYDADHDIAQQTEVIMADPEPGAWYIGNVNGTSSTFIYSMAAYLEPYPEPEPDPGPDPAGGEGEGEGEGGPVVEEPRAEGEGEGLAPGSPGDAPDAPSKKPEDSCLCSKTGMPLTWKAFLRR